jgi:hypothetical protein
MCPFTIKDAQGCLRACGTRFATLEEALAPYNVHMDREYHPEEFPFSVIDERTGETVHQWTL